jgi:hypothetical protein
VITLTDTTVGTRKNIRKDGEVVGQVDLVEGGNILLVRDLSEACLHELKQIVGDRPVIPPPPEIPEEWQ